MKIVDKVTQAIGKGQTVFSFEFFPPRTEEGVENLFERLERMVAYGPVFCDITWGAGGSTADVTLDIAKKMQNMICVETMMHLTCTNMPEEKLQSALDEVRKAGLQNILALRGDPPKGQEKFEVVEGGFSCALDLVKYIRKTHGDYFGICVAGYPEAHPDSIVEDAEQMKKNYWADIEYLKKKVEAGGDMIITQLFYDVDIFIQFVKDCQSVGIKAPIIPGIMPVMTYGGFKRMTGFCKTKVPQAILDVVEANKDNDEAIKNYGVELGAQMCRRLLDFGVPGLHMYSLNLDKTVLAILERMGIIDTSSVPRCVPWSLAPSGTQRAVEGVRPVFWQLRPKSYLARTQGWAAFPTTRWSGGEAIAPAGDVRRHTLSEARRAKATEAWGAALSGVQDVQRVFEKYYGGEAATLPWHEADRRVAASLQPELAKLAHAGLLAVNAQPAVNAVPSADAKQGWGGKGGYVYSKQYVELFVSPAAWKALLPKIKAAPSLTYIASTAAGEVETNHLAGAVNALSWGVFPGKEVVQPVVADVGSFTAWRDEAFAVWTAEWGSLYEEGSASKALLKDLASSWYLVSLTENDYISGDVFKVLQ